MLDVNITFHITYSKFFLDSFFKTKNKCFMKLRILHFFFLRKGKHIFSNKHQKIELRKFYKQINFQGNIDVYKTSSILRSGGLPPIIMTLANLFLFTDISKRTLKNINSPGSKRRFVKRNAIFNESVCTFST